MGGGAGGSIRHWFFKLYIIQLDFPRLGIVVRHLGSNSRLPSRPLPCAPMLPAHRLVPGEHRALVAGAGP